MRGYSETGICTLCGEPYDHFGNNPQPVLPDFHQRVCDKCNTMKVIPARLYRHRMHHEVDELRKEWEADAEAKKIAPGLDPKIPDDKHPGVQVKPKKKRQSRADRWSTAVGACKNLLEQIEPLITALEEAASELHSVQEEYTEWKDNLPEGLSQSPVGDKLEEVCNLEIEDLANELRQAYDDADGKLDEAESVDLPQGFGRD